MSRAARLPRRRRADAAFTLLEVIVAFAVLSLAVVVAIQGFAAGLRLLKLSGDHQEATLLADQKLREITTPTPGRDSGTEGRFVWERSTREVAAPDLAVAGQPTKWHVYEIDVIVKWREGTRQVRLASLRTLPDRTLLNRASTGIPRKQ